MQPPSQRQQQLQQTESSSHDVCMEDATAITASQQRQQQKSRPHSKGREELYRSVEDLRVHGHGTRLYLDVASLMDYAARETVRRLCYWDDASTSSFDARESGSGGSDIGIDVIIDPNTGHVGYDMKQICTTINVFDHQSDSGDGLGSSSYIGPPLVGGGRQQQQYHHPNSLRCIICRY